MMNQEQTQTHMTSDTSLAILGGSGLVGQEVLTILEEKGIRLTTLKLLGSERSLGKTMTYFGESIPVEPVSEESFADVDWVFSSVPAEVGKKWVPVALSKGCRVIDDSSLFRMNPEVPLVVPEINPESISSESNLVATPNCSTTPLTLCLKPLLDHYGLKRVVVSTYQAVSGAGQKALEELSKQTIQLMSGESSELKNEVFPRQMAFNCLPWIGNPQPSGYSDEEEKVVNETRKILGLSSLPVTCTAVRVPTFNSHGLSVNIELEDSFDTIDEIRACLEGFVGVTVIDRPDQNIFAINQDATGSDQSFVSRIRRDESVESGINMWIICDNLRKGAALNMIQVLNVMVAL